MVVCCYGRLFQPVFLVLYICDQLGEPRSHKKYCLVLIYFYSFDARSGFVLPPLGGTILRGMKETCFFDEALHVVVVVVVVFVLPYLCSL